jgi:hypothetical protein
MDNKEPDVVPICLYIDKYSKTNFMSFPTKFRENGKTVLRCEEMMNNEMIQFYVINPEIRPIPAAMVLICVQVANDVIMDVSVLYDEYNTTKNCIRLITWLIPTPYTTPLYVKKKEQNVYLSFDDEDYDGELVLTMYVLTDPRNNLKHLAGHKKNSTDGFNIVNNIPEFRFGTIDNRIVPEPGGITISKLIPLFEKNLSDPMGIRYQPSLLGILENRYGENPSSKKNEYILPLIIFTTIIFILVTTLVIFKMKNLLLRRPC